MKNWILILVLTTIVLGLCSASAYYVNLSANDTSKQLQHTVALANQENFDQAKESLQTVQSTWKKHRSVLMMYTDQEILDEIDDYLASLGALAEHHPEDFIPTATLCLCKLKEMQKRENLSLYSWF